MYNIMLSFYFLSIYRFSFFLFSFLCIYKPLNFTSGIYLHNDTTVNPVIFPFVC